MCFSVSVLFRPWRISSVIIRLSPVTEHWLGGTADTMVLSRSAGTMVLSLRGVRNRPKIQRQQITLLATEEGVENRRDPVGSR